MFHCTAMVVLLNMQSDDCSDYEVHYKLAKDVIAKCCEWLEIYNSLSSCVETKAQIQTRTLILKHSLTNGDRDDEKICS